MISIESASNTADAEPVRTGRRRARVVIADDEDSVRTEVEYLLSPHYDVVAQARSGSRAIDQVGKHQPEIAILDISMPGMSGIEVTRQIVGSGAPTKVIILSVHDEPEYVEAAIAAGASAYVLKLSAAADLIPAIETVLDGGSVLPKPSGG